MWPGAGPPGVEVVDGRDRGADVLAQKRRPGLPLFPLWLRTSGYVFLPIGGNLHREFPGILLNRGVSGCRHGDPSYPRERRHHEPEDRHDEPTTLLSHVPVANKRARRKGRSGERHTVALLGPRA